MVIDKLSDYYRNKNSNIHRGVHYLSQQATYDYENTRENVRKFINASNKREIVFTRGTTEAINLVASSFGKRYLNPGDEVIVSGMEHHSNIIPWQLACEERKARLKVIPLNENGELDLDHFSQIISNQTKMVAVTHISNALGIVNPIKNIIDIAHGFDVPVLIDGAQSVPHTRVDMQDLGCDFYCFSSHKMYGPMGVGVLYGKEKYLKEMPPYQGGGEMINSVTFEKSTYNEIPFKFEAGTPNVADVIGLDAAIQYLNTIGMDEIEKYETDLFNYASAVLSSIEKLRIIGKSNKRTGVISFLLGNIHPYDAGTIIDRFGIAVRTGHHCAQPVIDHFKLTGTIRASFGLYNTKHEVDLLAEAIKETMKMFGE